MENAKDADKSFLEKMYPNTIMIKNVGKAVIIRSETVVCLEDCVVIDLRLLLPQSAEASLTRAPRNTPT